MKLSIKIIFLFCLLNCLGAYSQQGFPNSWIGNYSGNLMIYGVDSVKMKVDMKLEINKTDYDTIHQWKLTYDLNGKKDVRDYYLVKIDAQKGHFQLDERNSIFIDSYLANNNILTSYFKVENSFIISTYTKINKEVIFEIIASNSNPINETGATTFDGEEIPLVNSFEVTGRQRAILKKTN